MLKYIILLLELPIFIFLHFNIYIIGYGKVPINLYNCLVEQFEKCLVILVLYLRLDLIEFDIILVFKNI